MYTVRAREKYYMLISYHIHIYGVVPELFSLEQVERFVFDTLVMEF